ncbi:hypothetical protein H072_255 [Dactylellina haptotyla CBS 200.50]|uniref:Uncharacterized protein n=1 Tax=Dactylellina haptotyla (strain CBS 200.50) TaxID=1284197 RepID=S8ASL4_DACHA|nr:hypothetical protein H072_255 [Dactylellina haptotyla CBS 200.50]
MQLSHLLTALTLASSALAGPVKPTGCNTEYTVTTSYKPVTTIYKTIAALPADLNCGTCTNLVVKTKTIGKSIKATRTVTLESTLIYIPICGVFPTPPPCIKEYTVTTTLTGTTTIYKEIAAVPLEIDCKGCDLKVITKTVGNAKPTKTVTKDYTLLHPPVCTEFPTKF